MQNFKKTFYALTVLCFTGSVFSKGLNIDISLDSEIYLNSQKIFIEKLGELKTKNDIKDLLEEQDWIDCLLYTSPSPRDRSLSRMPSSA